MKNIIIATAFLFSAVVIAQKIEPKHEIIGKFVKSTYFHDNGQIAQTGFYLNGKVHGQWASFDQTGTKMSLGNFEQGTKVGKWFFWSDKNLSEVDYTNSRVAAIKTWTQDAIAKN